eukprot:3845283-Pyramimonas_sp.AAC.1
MTILNITLSVSGSVLFVYPILVLFHAPGDDEWLSELILTSSLTPSPSAMLRYASCCDAFVHAHSSVRTGSSADVEQAFHARLRFHSRRHAAICKAWTELRNNGVTTRGSGAF